MSTTDAGCRLGAEPYSISTLDLTQLIDTGGTYPQPGTGPATNVMVMVRTLTYGGPAYGAPSCEGQLLPIAPNQALFSLLGTTYGGDGMRQFGLPNLHGLIAIGGGPSQGRTALSLAMTYLIAADAAFGSSFPMLGAIALFAGLNPPAGWLLADGSIVPIVQNVPLFEAIGTTYGGDGASTFALPDLRGSAALGAGQGAVAPVALGQRVTSGPDTPVAGLGLNYIVNVSGGVPPSQGNGGFPDSASILGEVIAFAGANPPAGWLPADGREMLIADNQTLFELIGTSFGGDGQTSFALPDLRCRMVVGT
jgi:microcystin-dependent protein